MPTNLADMDNVQKILEALKRHGLIDRQIGDMMGGVHRDTIGEWRRSRVITTLINQEKLVLVRDITEVFALNLGRNFHITDVVTFFSTRQPILDHVCPSDFIRLQGASAREDLLLLAKNFSEYLLQKPREAKVLAELHRCNSHQEIATKAARDAILILDDVGFSSSQIGEMIGYQDGRDVDNLRSQRIVRPTKLEMNQLEQAAGVVRALAQHYDRQAVVALMRSMRPQHTHTGRSISQHIAEQNEQSVIQRRSARHIHDIVSRLVRIAPVRR